MALPAAFSGKQIPSSWTGGYALNGWMYKGDWSVQDNRPSTVNAFCAEADIQKPSLTPVFADGMWVDAWPKETDQPARNLLEGANILGYISVLTIARHGAGPSKAYQSISPGEKLPRAINISFADGHVDLVQLEKLWELNWHKNWTTPSSRPR